MQVQCPQPGKLRELQLWGGGGRGDNSLQYFEFGLQYPLETLVVSVTYFSFKSKDLKGPYYEKLTFSMLVHIYLGL